MRPISPYPIDNPRGLRLNGPPLARRLLTINFRVVVPFIIDGFPSLPRCSSLSFPSALLAVNSRRLGPRPHCKLWFASFL
ncbi:Uncharacterized protein HZ326_10470 [Fusarium oxysporum f. sp. albedinis]|nr:Uncharacterized protein HZ326_10470 [Fusarium oxysporum f. sp. albedinis]